MAFWIACLKSYRADGFLRKFHRIVFVPRGNNGNILYVFQRISGKQRTKDHCPVIHAFDAKRGVDPSQLPAISICFALLVYCHVYRPPGDSTLETVPGAMAFSFHYYPEPYRDIYVSYQRHPRIFPVI